MTKHTPGPWSLAADPSHFYTYSTVTAGGQIVAQVGGPKDTLESLQANARLIAAAPDLLEALIAIRDNPYPSIYRPASEEVINACGEAWRKALAAINAATDAKITSEAEQQDKAAIVPPSEQIEGPPA